jgi:hypothetical protein
MDYKLHKMKKRHQKRSPNRVHGEPGGQVFIIIKCSGFGKSQHDKQAKHTKQTKTTFLNRYVDGRVKKCPALGMILWTRRYIKKRVKD